MQGVQAEREFVIYSLYKGKVISRRNVDFSVESKVSLEIKAVIKLDDGHLAQAINYLEVHNLEIGMLINFGAKSLEYKRLINPKYNTAFQMSNH